KLDVSDERARLLLRNLIEENPEVVVQCPWAVEGLAPNTISENTLQNRTCYQHPTTRLAKASCPWSTFPRRCFCTRRFQCQPRNTLRDLRSPSTTMQSWRPETNFSVSRSTTKTPLPCMATRSFRDRSILPPYYHS